MCSPQVEEFELYALLSIQPVTRNAAPRSRRTAVAVGCFADAFIAYSPPLAIFHAFDSSAIFTTSPCSTSSSLRSRGKSAKLRPSADAAASM